MKMHPILCIAISLLSAQVIAADFNNGCGSGWNEPVVPDTIAPLCIDFRQSCGSHDNCYSRCLPGGENFGKPVCNQTAAEARAGRRAACDSAFLDDMRRSCQDCDAIRRPACKGVALLYKLAVVWGGGGNFGGREIPPWYFQFLQSEAAKSFDFDAFERDIIEVKKLSGIEKENLLLLVENSGMPSLQVKSIKSGLTTDLRLLKSGIQVRERLTFGTVDLTDAVRGQKPISPEIRLPADFNVEMLRREQTFKR